MGSIGLGSAVGLAANLYGGIKAGNAMQQIRDSLVHQQEANRDWYDRRYNEDSTQRADAQRVLNKAEEIFRQRNQQQQGSAAVMGSTDEAVASSKAANANALADAVSKIDVASQSRKDGIEDKYMSTDRSIQNQINDMDMKMAQNTQQMAGQVADAASNIDSNEDGRE